ncbi:ANF protein, partial [Ardeotis kori]|nr:ANF protein [Ardeotis kori]
MQLSALCCRASLLLLVLPWAGAQPGGGGHDAEPWSLQDLLEALGQLREEERDLGLEDEPVTGAEDDGSEWDIPAEESGPPGAPLPAPSPPQPAGRQSQWRSLLSSHRRRHFSGCFGTRMERIGAQTGLGCNQYKARKCRDGAR